MLEEVIRLQNELALSLRRSFDTINEERVARLTLENSYKFQIENVLQLNGRLKRAEDSLNEDRSAMQALIAYTRNFEQMTVTTQKDLSIKMGMSILLGKKVFNITELLDKDVINSLIGTEFEWLYHIMKALGQG